MKALKLLQRDVTSEESLDGLITYFNAHNYNILDYFDAIVTSTMHGGHKHNPLHRNPESDVWESDHNDSEPEYTIVLLKSRIYLTGYGFTTNAYGNPDFPKSWYVYGSNDRNNWTQIDYKQTDYYFTNYSQSKSFTVEKQEPFRFFRFTIEGNNTNGSKYFCFQSIDLFGSIFIENSSFACSCPIFPKSPFLIYIFILLKR